MLSYYRVRKAAFVLTLHAAEQIHGMKFNLAAEKYMARVLVSGKTLATFERPSLPIQGI